MKNLLLIILSTSFSLHAQNEYDENNRKHGPWSYEADSGSIFNISTPLVVTTFKHDTINGLYRVYDNEILRFEANVIMGKAEGIAHRYYDNGKIFEILRYKNGVITMVFWFDQKGRIYKIYEVDEEIPDGLELVFSEKGGLESSQFRKGTMEDGQLKIFKKGKVKSIHLTEENIFKGVFHGNDLPK